MSTPGERSAALAEILAWLLEALPERALDSPIPESQLGAAQTALLSCDQLGAAVAAEMGELSPEQVTRELGQIRDGALTAIPGARRARLVAAIGVVLDLPNGFFDEPGPRARARFLRRQLEHLGVTTLTICRVPAASARARLRAVLISGAHSDLLGSTRRSHRGGASSDPPPVRAMPSRGNAPKRPAPVSVTWDDASPDVDRRRFLTRSPRHEGRAGSTLTEEDQSEVALRQFCRDLLDDLGLAAPLVPEELCSALSERRGRRVVLRSADLGSTASVGYLIIRTHSDLILTEASAPPQQQAHVIFHEVIHLVRGHLEDQGGEGNLTCGALVPARSETPEEERNLYSELQEWEAETGATYLTAMTLLRRQPARLSGTSESAPEQGLASAFGLSAGGWP